MSGIAYSTKGASNFFKTLEGLHFEIYCMLSPGKQFYIPNAFPRVALFMSFSIVEAKANVNQEFWMTIN